MKIYRIIKNLLYRLISKRTIGVRALLIHNSQILLVKHTYMSDWYTIGGGVKKGESPLAAILREI